MLATLLLVSCGGRGGFDPAANPAKTRFAIAQFIEERALSLLGPYQHADALATICVSESSTSWFCTSTYAPPNGLVTSVNQDAADTQVRYDAQRGKFTFSAVNSVAGQGIVGTLPTSAIASLVKSDGNQVGAETQIGPLQLTPGDLAKRSQSTLSTIAPLLTSASRAELAQAQQRAGSGSSTAPAQPSTATEPSTSSSTEISPTRTGNSGTTTGPNSSPASMSGDCTSAGPVHVFDHHGLSCSDADAIATQAWTVSALRHGRVANIEGWTCQPWVRAATECRRGANFIDITPA